MNYTLKNDPRQLSLLTQPKLIGLWSPAPQSGKSTAAERMAAVLPDYPIRLAFADPLRSIIATTLRHIGVDRDVIRERVWMGVAKEEPIPGAYGKSFVDFAMKIGTDLGRGWLSDTVWVDTYRTRAKVFLEDSAPVLTDDVRFRNEAAAVRELGGVLVGIRRPGATVSTARAPAEGHLTFDDMDHVIENDGCLTALNLKVDGLMLRLGFSF